MVGVTLGEWGTALTGQMRRLVVRRVLRRLGHAGGSCVCGGRSKLCDAAGCQVHDIAHRIGTECDACRLARSEGRPGRVLVENNEGHCGEISLCGMAVAVGIEVRKVELVCERNQ